MTWPVRSNRFGLYTGTPAANTPVWWGTVPAGKTWLIKEWSMYNAGAAAKDFVVLIDVGGTVYVVDKASAVPSAGVNGNNQRHLVLNAGNKIGFQISTATAVHCTCSGAQLG